MAEPVLHVRGLMKSFGGVRASDNVELSVEPFETHAVIGPNGAGKTTLIAQLSGELAADAGTITFKGRDMTRLPSHRRSMLGLARSFQITSVFLDMTVVDNVALAVQAHRGHSFRFWKPAAADAELVEPARRTLEQVGLEARACDPASALSHGERRQLEIAMALATEPELLLLDEPMAGHGAGGIRPHGGDPEGAQGRERPCSWWSMTWTRFSPWPTGSRCWSTAGSSPAARPGYPQRRAVRRAYLGEEGADMLNVRASKPSTAPARCCSAWR